MLQLFAFVCSGLQKLLIQNNHLSQLPEELDSLQQLELVLGMATLWQTLQLKCAVGGHLPSGNTYGGKRHKKAMKLKVGVLRKSPQYTYKAVLLVIDTLQNNLQSTLCNI